MKKISVFLLYLVFFMYSSVVEAKSTSNVYNLPDAQLACLKIQKYYNSIKSFRADFKQIYSKRFHGDQKPEYGKIYIKKPGQMLWDYQKPHKKQFIIDGKKVWIYEPVNKQVIWSKIKNSALPAPVKFLWGKGNLIGEFDVKIIYKSKFGGKDLVVIKMKPKKKSKHFRSVLFVTKKTGEVVQSIVYDKDGNKNRIYFYNIKLNHHMKKSLFKFKIPKGVQVIHASGAKSSSK